MRVFLPSGCFQYGYSSLPRPRTVKVVSLKTQGFYLCCCHNPAQIQRTRIGRIRQTIIDEITPQMPSWDRAKALVVHDLS